ncbi:MAG: hypothetical protein H0V09_08910 [Gemmatimonadetes bacterium]|nr:hypothetical protein [Gemmatimonadota bacterium]
MTSPNARDQELFVNCKACGFALATGLRAHPPAGDVPAAGMRGHRCPRCGRIAAYAPEEYSRRE